VTYVTKELASSKNSPP